MSLLIGILQTKQIPDDPSSNDGKDIDIITRPAYNRGRSLPVRRSPSRPRPYVCLMSEIAPRTHAPLALLTVILLGMLALLAAQAQHPLAPSEDAYITYRYARNLAENHGIVWNVGENPVEGSTEFLWTALLAGTSRLTGLNIEQSARALNLFIGLIAVITLAAASYAFSGRRLLPALFATLAFAAGPLSYHIRAGFATPLFTWLLLIITIALYQLVFLPAGHRWRRRAFIMLPLAGLLLGLTRPEGVLFAGLALLAAFILLDGPGRRRLLLTTVALLVIPGLIYFLWRWRYFGYFLPNTFYVKNAGSLLHLRYFPDIYELFRFMAPLFLLIGIGYLLDAPRSAVKKLVILAPAIIFPWSYLLIDQLQNLGKRFQYPVYPIFLLMAAMALGQLALRTSPPELRRKNLALIAAGVMGMVFILFAPFVALERMTLMLLLIAILAGIKFLEGRQLGAQGMQLALAFVVTASALVIFNAQVSARLADSFYPTVFDDREVIGKALEPFADKGYTVVASEAGWIPYFSRWRAIDPFGLNDEYVTHHGLSFDYLDQQGSDVIMYHQVKNPHPPRWAEMVQMLRDYAEARGYILAAVIQRKGPDDLHVYWVKPDNPDAEALIRAITEHDDRFIYQYKAAE